MSLWGKGVGVSKNQITVVFRAKSEVEVHILHGLTHVLLVTLHLVVELLKKKKYNADTATRQEQQKMYGFLYRKGFRPDIIGRALSLDITSISV